MFFGEYLVVKKVITEDQLLDALTYQVEHLPSFLKVLRGEKILSTSDLFKMIKIQLETNSDLVGVLRDENKLDEKQLHQIFTKQASSRIMLGQVLVELKIIDQGLVETNLYNFLRDKDNLQSIQKEKQVESIASATKPIEMSEAALESLRELGMVMDTPVQSAEIAISAPVEASIFVEEFLNVYNTKMKNKLNKILEILRQSENDDSDISNYFNSLYRDLHVLKGAAQVAELSLIEGFVGEWEIVIEKILTMKNEQVKSWCKDGLPFLTEGISHLWKMRELVDRDKNEANIESVSNVVAKIKSFQ